MLLAAADLVARTIAAPRQLPVGAIMALVGAPLFIVMLRGGRDRFARRRLALPRLLRRTRWLHEGRSVGGEPPDGLGTEVGSEEIREARADCMTQAEECGRALHLRLHAEVTRRLEDFLVRGLD